MKYLYAVALALFLCLGLYAYIESERVDSLKADNKVLTGKVEASEAARKKEQQDTIDANNRAKQTQIEKQVIEDEAQKNRDCINAGTCGVKFVYQHAACSPMYNASTSGSNANGTASQELRDFASWANDLEAAIKDNLLQIKKLQEDVAIRSNPNYCKPL